MIKPASSPASFAWDALAAETVRHLQALIRLDTVNPPGNELRAAEYLAAVLRAEGVEPLVLTSAPGRGNLVARLKGSGELPPLLLYGHIDVVGAEPQHWTHPPFAAEVADGQVWGRGTLDMKGTVAQQLMVCLLLKRLGAPLRRDLIFAATADEEIGGPDGYGLAWLVKNHPDLLRAEFGLTEVGGYNQELGGQRLYPIQTAEKGTVWLKLRARGSTGHASRPHPDNAVVRLARAVERLAARGLEYHLTDAAAGYLTAVSATVGGELGAALAALRTPAGAAEMLNGPLAGHEMRSTWFAMLHNTATPTGLKAGQQTNVIPGEAEAVVDGRNLPGTDTEAFLRELRAALGEAGLGVEIEVTMESPSLETPSDTPLFRLMADTLRQHDPLARPLPYMMSGATDAKYLAPLGVPSYGFAPLQLPPGFPFNHLMHAHDERTPVAGLGWGMRVLFDVVQTYCR